MEQPKSNIPPISDRLLEEDWRSSIRLYCTKNGFSDVSDGEVINELAKVSGFAATPKEITYFLQGSSIECLISARAKGVAPEVALSFRSNQENQNEIIKTAAQASGCVSFIGSLIAVLIMACLAYFFYFSDTAKFMDSLR